MEKQIKIHLQKFNKQSEQYYSLLVFDATSEQIVAVELSKRQPVEGYYKYDYTFNGVAQTIYSVSPALFDHLETVTT